MVRGQCVSVDCWRTTEGLREPVSTDRYRSLLPSLPSRTSTRAGKSGILRESVRRSRSPVAWDDALANETFAAALKGGVLFDYHECIGPQAAGSTVAADPSGADERLLALGRIPGGCMIVECCVAKDVATLSFTASGGATRIDRLQFLAEAFRLAFRETLRVFPATPSQARKARVSLEVQPFSDLFFKDCTHQRSLLR